MTAPTVSPDWATNPTYTAGGPNKIAPSAGKVGEGWDENEEPSAEQFNYVQNAVGLWIAYLQANKVDVSSLAIPTLSYTIMPNPIGATAASGWSLLTSSDFSWQSSGNSGISLFLPISVPLGATITQFFAEITPQSGHGAMPASKPTTQLYRSDETGPTLIATATDTTSTVVPYENQHLITSAVIAEVVPQFGFYFLKLTGESGTNSIGGTKFFSHIKYSVSAIDPSGRG